MNEHFVIHRPAPHRFLSEDGWVMDYTDASPFKSLQDAIFAAIVAGKPGDVILKISRDGPGPPLWTMADPRDA